MSLHALRVVDGRGRFLHLFAFLNYFVILVIIIYFLPFCMRVAASTIPEYIAAFSAEDQLILERVRKFVNTHRDKNFEEDYNRGMISWQVPFSILPKTYNNQPLSFGWLARQKNNFSLYLMCVYADENNKKLLEDGFRRIGKKPNMGKGCIRFKKLEDLPRDEIGQILQRCTLDKFVERYRKIKN